MSNDASMEQELRYQPYVKPFTRETMSNGAPIVQKLQHALTLTKLAQGTRSPEMTHQHLSEIERILEYAIRQFRVNDIGAADPAVSLE